MTILGNKQDNPLTLTSRVKPMEANNRTDINGVRDAMCKIGEYNGAPKDHYDRFMMNAPLRTSIERFQKKKGLEVDGTLLPGGETEREINKSLLKKEEAPRKNKRITSLLQPPLFEEVKAVGHFLKNYKDMREANTKGADKFFHCKAHYEATKEGPKGEAISHIADWGRELVDFPKNMIKENKEFDPPRPMTFAESLDDCAEDMKANRYGRNGSRKNRENSDAGEFCYKIFPVKGLDKKYYKKMEIIRKLITEAFFQKKASNKII